MRGAEPGEVVLFSYVALEDWIPAEHPLRRKWPQEAGARGHAVWERVVHE